MLYKYKTNYEKIAMGLLSFIPHLKDIPHLQAEVQWYSAEADRNLFLWKTQTDDFVGIIGTELNEDVVLVRHLAVSPGARNEGITYQMLDELALRFPDKKILGSMETVNFVTKWERKKDEEAESQ